MPETVTLNNNLSECLKPILDIGGTTYVNLCTGAESFVPWGSMLWGLIGMIGVVVACLVIALLRI